MTIETDLNRIANALEKLAGLTVVKETSAPVAKTVEVKNVEAETAQPEVTEDELRTLVCDYMNATDKQKAVGLLVKYGAKKEKPMIKDVTDKNGLYKEITSCLKPTK